MLIDEAVITVVGGHGGAGKASFYPGRSSGPNGGDGGRGADVVAVINPNMSDLNKFRSKTKYKGKAGNSGESFLKNGADAPALIIPVPPGTAFTDLETGSELEVSRANPQILLAAGGKGGRGNNAFKSSTHRAPKTAEEGLSGEEKKYRVVMRLIADVGLIGFPNAGKSSLLNTLTKANSKIGAYQFTTLEPNLGDLHGFIVADIPGLIEGASKGRGLGVKFLKHIEKVKIIAHCISLESTDLMRDYETVRRELTAYNPKIAQCTEIIVLTKSDLFTKEEIEIKKKKIKSLKKPNFIVSVLDDAAIKKLSEGLIKHLS